MDRNVPSENQPPFLAGRDSLSDGWVRALGKHFAPNHNKSAVCLVEFQADNEFNTS